MVVLPVPLWELIMWLAGITVIFGLLAFYALVAALGVVGKALDAIAYSLKDWSQRRRSKRERWPADKVARMKMIKAMNK